MVAPSLIRGWISVLANTPHRAAMGIKSFIIFGVFVQSGASVCKKRCHLVDEGTCTTGTDAVHTLLYITTFKVDDLGILTAKLDSNICLWCIVLQAVDTAITSCTNGTPRCLARVSPPEPVMTGDAWSVHQAYVRFPKDLKEFPGCSQNASHSQKIPLIFHLISQSLQL